MSLSFSLMNKLVFQRKLLDKIFPNRISLGSWHTDNQVWKFFIPAAPWRFLWIILPFVWLCDSMLQQSAQPSARACGNSSFQEFRFEKCLLSLLRLFLYTYLQTIRFDLHTSVEIKFGHGVFCCYGCNTAGTATGEYWILWQCRNTELYLCTPPHMSKDFYCCNESLFPGWGKSRQWIKGKK